MNPRACCKKPAGFEGLEIGTGEGVLLAAAHPERIASLVLCNTPGRISDEIRQIQITLREKGFYDGEPDGKFGPRTRRALMTFQQRQGLQASGRLDTQTTAALGISTKNGEQDNGGRPSTTGQGNGSQQPSANDGRPSGNQGMSSGPNNRDGNQPSTTGQGSDKMKQQPPANQDVGNAQPGDQGRSSASGQGNATQSPSPNMNQNSGAAQRPGGQAK